METPTTEIYTLSLHDALPIFNRGTLWVSFQPAVIIAFWNDDRHSVVERLHNLIRVSSDYRECQQLSTRDRKSTRLNSCHMSISYAVFCLKKKINVLHNRR